MPFTEQDQLAVTTIRTLSIDGVEKANAGHPGLPMGAAPMAYVLWSRFMKYNPKDPNWVNRDRFVLSAGHGSMLLYSLLHLTGYEVSIDDLKQFRQWGSKTPGHPEFGHTSGVEATTGPLGQGLANAVGLAMAERFLASTFNREGHEVIDHYTYVLCGDGDLMEGITSEASSLAGHLKLNKLIVLYDSNDISLDGPTDWTFTEDVKMRYRSYGWNVLRVEDGNNLDEIEQAIAQAKSLGDAPTLIEVKTIIGYGSPNKQGTSGVHGSALGPDEVKLAKETYGWTYEDFFVPAEVKSLFSDLRHRLAEEEKSWQGAFDAYQKAYADDAKTLQACLAGEVNVDFDNVLPEFNDAAATRDAFGTVINAIAPHMPTLLGGSADLSGSNKTLIKGSDHFKYPEFTGKNVFYGVREHSMAAMMNGICLHGGIFPYAGTFLVFVDYLRPAARLSALMKQPALYVLTHDSIAVGEDGPTHEPVEQIASLRVIPGMKVFRPADGTETGLAVKYALTHRDAPVALALSRQKLPSIDEIKENKSSFDHGAYVIYQHEGGDDIALLASGSEVHLALEAAKKLASEGVKARVISAPSLEVFDAQDETYRNQVLPPTLKKRVAVEMAHPMSWYKYVGLDGEVIGVDKYGASAPGDVVVEKYGFTVDHVYSVAKSVLNR